MEPTKTGCGCILDGVKHDFCYLSWDELSPKEAEWWKTRIAAAVDREVEVAERKAYGNGGP